MLTEIPTKSSWFIMPIMPVIVLALLAFLFTGCGGRASANDVTLSDLDIQVREDAEVVVLNPNDLLSVHFIDVGEGDAILIVQGNHAMLIDGGPEDMGTVVFTYIRNQGITSLDYVVATHPFADHVGGLPDVLRRITTRNVLLPMVYHDTPAYAIFFLVARQC